MDGETEGPCACGLCVEVPKPQLVFWSLSHPSSPRQKIPISERLGDVDPQCLHKLPAVCRPGPTAAGGGIPRAVAWDGFAIVSYLDFPVIGTKTWPLGFARWKTGLLDTCEGTRDLVITQGLIFVLRCGCLNSNLPFSCLLPVVA